MGYKMTSLRSNRCWCLLLETIAALSPPVSIPIPIVVGASLLITIVLVVAIVLMVAVPVPVVAVTVLRVAIPLRPSATV